MELVLLLGALWSGDLSRGLLGWRVGDHALGGVVVMSDVTTREFHPVANIFPLMDGAAFVELVEDVRLHGLREPVTLHPDGRVVDGRNRYRACMDVGIEPTYRTWDEAVHGDLVAFVLSLNLRRRH